MPRRRLLFLIPSLLLAACDPAVIAPQSGAVSASPSMAAVTPAVTPTAVTTPTAAPTPTPNPSATPRPSPTPPKAPAPVVEGTVIQYLGPDDPRPSAGSTLSDVSVTALSKTDGKPYYREAIASPRFEFTDLPYEAEIEITATKTGWARGIMKITTGSQPDRKAITVIIKRVYYGYKDSPS